MRSAGIIALLLCAQALLVCYALAARPELRSAAGNAASTHRPSTQVLNPTHAGYLPLQPGDPNGGEMYYIYFEAKEPDDDNADTRPIVLWLNGGPGCSGLFGMVREGHKFMLQELCIWGRDLVMVVCAALGVRLLLQLV